MHREGSDERPSRFRPPSAPPSGVEFQRPLSASWSATLGAHAQMTNCIDEHGKRLTTDCFGAPLTISGRPDDEVLMASLSTSYK